MLSDVLAIKDDLKAVKVCRAWLQTEDVLEISYLMNLSPTYVSKTIHKLKRLKILVEGNKLGEHVQKYLDSVVVSHLKDVSGGRS